MTRSWIPLVTVVCASAACSDASLRRPPDVTVTDSAGVRVVRVPALGSFDVPEWSTTRSFGTSDLDGSPLELFGVVGAVVTSDSTLVIANSGTSELIFVDRGTGSVHRVGREGDGPGEFRRLRHLLLHPSGDVLAFDWRFSRFDPTGEFVATERLDSESAVVDLKPLTVFEDGTVVAVLGEQRIFRGRERRDTVPLMAFRPRAAEPDTLGVWLGLERAFATIGAGRLLVPIVFARTVFVSSNGRETVIGSTDSLDVTVYSDLLEPVLRLIAPPEPRTPSRDAVERWREGLLERIPTGTGDARRAWSEAPVRDSYPGFDGLVVDDKRRLWVGEYPEPGAIRRRWIVFSAEGVAEAQIRLPLLAARPLPGLTELLTVRGNELVLLRTSELGEESVEIWTLQEPR